ncbi:MAG TPA: carbohydrate ABC transporter permease, partial [Candidatus Blautia stercoravium]|nr:carbohydrate ABC transporter permease [Candidatus Blautia stercoravium]
MMLNKRNQRISKIVTYALLVIFSLYCIFPFIWMLISALKPKTEIRTATPTFLIQEPTLENFHRVLVDAGFLRYIKNSLFVSIAACLLSMVIAVMAGYALSRYYK